MTSTESSAFLLYAGALDVCASQAWGAIVETLTLRSGDVGLPAKDVRANATILKSMRCAPMNHSTGICFW